MTTNMSREQLHHALERKERQYAKLSRRVEYLRDRAAMADRLYKELDRASRTHRLCCRAGILEKYDPYGIRSLRRAGGDERHDPASL